MNINVLVEDSKKWSYPEDDMYFRGQTPIVLGYDRKGLSARVFDLDIPCEHRPCLFMYSDSIENRLGSLMRYAQGDELRAVMSRDDYLRMQKRYARGKEPSSFNVNGYSVIPHS